MSALPSTSDVNLLRYRERVIDLNAQISFMAGTSALMADNRRPWRRQIQRISRKSRQELEPGFRPFISLAANFSPRVVLSQGRAISLGSAASTA